MEGGSDSNYRVRDACLLLIEVENEEVEWDKRGFESFDPFESIEVFSK